MTRHTITIATVLLLALSATAGAGSPEASGMQSEQQLKTTTPVTMKYLLYLPEDYESRDDWPLVLFLHGAGERGDDLEDVKRHGPPKLVEAGREFPFILVSPQCPRDHWWQPRELTALLDEIVKRYHVDEDRIYLTGLSMGGYGTWDLATTTPRRFAAVAPICGGGIPYRAKRLVGTPVWAFHGAQDGVVPLERSKVMVEALQAAGGDPTFTIYPEAGHDSWTETYNNPELYQWMLKQERGEE